MRDTTNNRYIDIWPADKYDIKFPDITEENDNEPLVAAVKDRELWLARFIRPIYVCATRIRVPLCLWNAQKLKSLTSSESAENERKKLFSSFIRRAS